MNIKKLFSSFAAAILVFAACEETNPDLGDPSVTLSKTQLEFAKEGGSQEITLNSGAYSIVRNGSASLLKRELRPQRTRLSS